MAALVVCSAALLALTLDRTVTTPLRVTAIYVVIVTSGIARAFLQPARIALGAELVPRAMYSNAITWRASTWQVAAVIGPAIGGFLYAGGGAQLAYATDTVLMIVGLCWMLAVRHRSPTRAPIDGSVTESLLSGLRFVRAESMILGAMSLDLFGVLFGGAVALLPIFARDILHVGPTGLGILRAAPAFGAVFISAALAIRPVTRRLGPTMLASVAVFGLATIGFGLSGSFWLSVAFLALSGAFDMVSVVIRSTLIQLMTPEPLLGRVSAVNSIFVGSSNEIGAFESGVTAKLLGTIPSVVFGGLATLGVVGAIGWGVPSLRQLDVHPPH